MSLSELQKLVRDFSQAKLKPTPAHAWLLDLESEVGELAKEWLKGSQYGRAELELGEAWAEEMGDILFALLALAEETGVDLEASLRRVLKKYAQRIAEHGHSGSDPQDDF
jgi:NTP pyrophosphatase (non-canonical NTP hydrolase)